MKLKYYRPKVHCRHTSVMSSWLLQAHSFMICNVNSFFTRHVLDTHVYLLEYEVL